MRTFADWKEPIPGFMEADLVAHGGESAAGSFAHTLVLTDIASGWTECVALAVREGSLVVEALERLRTTMPFPLLGFDTDNGGEVINEAVLAYCTGARIEFTRIAPVPQERPGVGRAEERIRRSAPGRLSAARGDRCDRSALATLRRIAAVRELLPAVVQARRLTQD